jgi:divalent metal cation (Fe/Co/Zn/Cd) transporter
VSSQSDEGEGAPDRAPTEQRRSGVSVVDGAEEAATPEHPGGDFKSDMVFAFLLFVAASINFIVGDGWGSEAWLFPNVIATGMYLCGAVLAVHGMLQLHKTRGARPGSATSAETIDSPAASAPAWRRRFDAVWFIAVFVAYVALLPITGYIITTAMFYLVVFLALGLGGVRWGKRVAFSVLGSALATTALVAMFEYGFGVPLPGT